MRKGGMVAGAIVAAIGLFLMFFQVFRGLQTPIGGIGYSYEPYSQLGFYLLVIGIAVLVVSAAIPSPKPAVVYPQRMPSQSRYSSPTPEIAPQTTTIVKVRCQRCGHLSNEDAFFCKQCGATLRKASKNSS